MSSVSITRPSTCLDAVPVPAPTTGWNRDEDYDLYLWKRRKCKGNQQRLKRLSTAPDWLSVELFPEKAAMKPFPTEQYTIGQSAPCISPRRTPTSLVWPISGPRPAAWAIQARDTFLASLQQWRLRVIGLQERTRAGQALSFLSAGRLPAMAVFLNPRCTGQHHHHIYIGRSLILVTPEYRLFHPMLTLFSD